MENSYLIDASVIVEIIRARFNQQKCLDFLNQFEGKLYITILTLSIAWHYGDLTSKVNETMDFLDNFELLELTQDNVQKAYSLWENQDFEDALQISCLLENNLTGIITLDKKLAQKYQSITEVHLV